MSYHRLFTASELFIWLRPGVFPEFFFRAREEVVGLVSSCLINRTPFIFVMESYIPECLTAAGLSQMPTPTPTPTPLQPQHLFNDKFSQFVADILCIIAAPVSDYNYDC